MICVTASWSTSDLCCVVRLQLAGVKICCLKLQWVYIFQHLEYLKVIVFYPSSVGWSELGIEWTSVFWNPVNLLCHSCTG